MGGQFVSFQSSMDAKQFLVSRIVEEANWRQVPLSDVERGMLFFSESYPTLPDMAEISERFESECDDEKYEKKISKLSRSAYRRDCRESHETARLWREAIKVLKREDHYILVMLDVPRSADDIWKLTLKAFVVAGLGLSVIVALNWAGHHILGRIPDEVLLLAFVLFLILLGVFGWSDKAVKTVGKWFGSMIGRIIRS